jgi:hypothetical protein
MFALLNRYTELFRKIYGQLFSIFRDHLSDKHATNGGHRLFSLLPQGEEMLVCAKLRSLRVERCLLAGLITNQLV